MDTLIHAVLQATIVSKCVLVLLLFMSLASWAFMFARHLALRSAKNRVLSGLDSAHRAHNLEAILQCMARDRTSPLYSITGGAVQEFNRLCRTGDVERLASENVRRALHFGIAGEIARLKSSLALLATAANTAPFIGLFGTVWGIMQSFTAIAQMKSVSLATVAPGIAEALVATAVGLFVAIPAVCGYNIFKARLSEIEGLCISFGGHLLNRLQQEGGRHPEGLNFAQGE
ncbi:MAG TPA: MotA/TolQ/ExbB proton channel family protein [Candidatus Desulfovibrio intestinipullorum]|uniref:MotA/TolQ/ExbB proton channel family protein n=1 Tax=Candidatus Desulfovibrio intestinipullorum TaxID=2838536 RepID=A0A9D1TPW2_9BACT|nr:MotA/TolQ/ExbB proton channel family protein [Candidatus Desulfovibrio intestinipullorum]